MAWKPEIQRLRRIFGHKREGGKRPLARPKRRWEEDTRMGLREIGWKDNIRIGHREIGWEGSVLD
jgi:hypothetical protein